MKKIITAIGNELLNNKIKKYQNVQIVLNDIQYKEGILEVLEENIDIDTIIISELLQGEIALKDLISKILNYNSKIKIILILELQNKDWEDYLYSKGVYKIIYNNEISIDELIHIIENNEKNNVNNYVDNYNKELIEEINKLKKIINENDKKINNKKIDNKIIKKIKNKKNNFKLNTQNNNSIDYKNKTNNKILKNKNYKLKNKNKINNNNKLKNINQNENIKYNLIKNKLNKIFFKNYRNSLIYNSEKKDKEDLNKKSKIISVTGTSGVGKSIFSVNLAKIKALNNYKVLLIDLDFINSSIHTILGVESYPQKNILEKNSKENYLQNYSNYNDSENKNIIKINKNIDLYTIKNKENINLYNNNIWNDNVNKIIKLVNNLKINYDYLIIDTNSNELKMLTAHILNLSDFNLFISDTNLLEINKSMKLIEEYRNLNNKQINNLNIIFNKYNFNSINFNLLKKLFDDFNIIGFLNYNSKYNKLINKNNKINFGDKKIRNELLELNKKII